MSLVPVTVTASCQAPTKRATPSRGGSSRERRMARGGRRRGGQPYRRPRIGSRRGAGEEEVRVKQRGGPLRRDTSSTRAGGQPRHQPGERRLVAVGGPEVAALVLLVHVLDARRRERLGDHAGAPAQVELVMRTAVDPEARQLAKRRGRSRH